MGSARGGHRHHRALGRQHRRRAQRRIACYLLLAVVAAAGALAIRHSTGRELTEPETSSQRAAYRSTQHREPIYALDQLDRIETRPGSRVYAYSVVAGGVGSVDYLRRVIAIDPVVADHYRQFDLSTARILPLAAAKLAYASYRIGDGVYWTRKRLTIPKGELIITDGEHLARVRCGNQLSDSPVEPTQTDEPSEAVLDSSLLPSVPFGFPIPPISPATRQAAVFRALLAGPAGWGGALVGGGGASSVTPSLAPGVTPDDPSAVIWDAGQDGSALVAGQSPRYLPNAGQPQPPQNDRTSPKLDWHLPDLPFTIPGVTRPGCRPEGQ